MANGSGAARVGESSGMADEFLRLVVVLYSETEQADPERFARARELLDDNPDIALANIHAAAAAGNTDVIGRFLDAEPSLINAKDGPFDWEPIMYAAYSRLPGISTLAAGRLLLARGADPNAHYMWGGQYKFTALTGVFGQGESGPTRLPEHPETEAFARLLLEAGADPNDSQAAYNRMFTPDNLCLKLLLEYGLGRDDKNNWLLQGEDGLYAHPQATMHYQLMHALRQRMTERVRLLVEHNVNLNRPDEHGRTPYELALLAGDRETAAYLEARGAEKIVLSKVDSFVATVMAGDEGGACAMVEADHGLIGEVLGKRPTLLTDAGGANNIDGLRAMIAAGFDVNYRHHTTALHQAAWHGHVDLIKMLVEAGADTTIRDTNHYAPPIGWARHNFQHDAVEVLKTCPMDMFTASIFGNLDWLERHTEREPQIVNVRFADIRPAGNAPCEGDWNTPLAVAAFHGQRAAVEWLLEWGADRTVTSPEGKTISDLAREQGHDAIAEMLDAGAR